MGGSIGAVSMSQTSPCCKFWVKATIAGYNGQDCALQYVVVDRYGRSTKVLDAPSFRPQSNLDEGSQEVYVPIGVPGTYYVQFRLLAPNGNEMDRKQSTSFNVTR
jgi:hypothetical protein